MSACPRPDKVAYESRDAATGALRRMSKKRTKGVVVYRCNPCGAWHLGRTIRKPTIARKALP